MIEESECPLPALAHYASKFAIGEESEGGKVASYSLDEEAIKIKAN